MPGSRVPRCVESRREAFEAPRRAGRSVTAGVIAFLAAILAARLLLAASTAAALGLVLLLAGPLFFFLMAALLGVRGGAVVAAFFVGATLAFRAVLLVGLPWPALLLVPVVVFSLWIASRVLRRMRDDAAPGAETEEE